MILFKILTSEISKYISFRNGYKKQKGFNFANQMKLKYIFPILLILFFFSCEKENKISSADYFMMAWCMSPADAPSKPITANEIKIFLLVPLRPFIKVKNFMNRTLNRI
ncbi:hypothetical protein LEP1GSC151_5217 [Leptospira interrogans serovar Grippotyphosa str. LT2186]|uniref:Uncharacterized protein n=1 Tax=Leptospira interrogans serovar Grippotyphosa str. LT2186 TaxID=1001599 RepID=M3I5H9_LEPIR|nr:hypothetical protein LEP1GSC151_5217 [Leptospira interrogans serovar Grippotyphosa str. LT2186]